MLDNNLSYTQLGFAFVFRKDSCYFHNATDTFFLFLLQKDFDIFHVLLFEAFLCVFDNSYLPFLYIEKNLIKRYFIGFSYALKIIYIICAEQEKLGTHSYYAPTVHLK